MPIVRCMLSSSVMLLLLQIVLWVKNEYSRSSATARVLSLIFQVERKVLVESLRASANSSIGQSEVREKVQQPPPQSFESTASAPDTWLMLAIV